MFYELVQRFFFSSFSEVVQRNMIFHFEIGIKSCIFSFQNKLKQCPSIRENTFPPKSPILQSEIDRFLAGKFAEKR